MHKSYISLEITRCEFIWIHCACYDSTPYRTVPSTAHALHSSRRHSKCLFGSNYKCYWQFQFRLSLKSRNFMTFYILPTARHGIVGQSMGSTFNFLVGPFRTPSDTHHTSLPISTSPSNWKARYDTFLGVRYHVLDDTVSFLTRGTPTPAGPTNWGVVLRTVGESLVGATTGHRSNVARSTKQPQQYFTTTTTTNNNKHWK